MHPPPPEAPAWPPWLLGWRRPPTGEDLRAVLRTVGKYLAGVAVVTLLLSLFLFALDPMMNYIDGVRGAATWELDLKKLEEEPPPRILPLWFTWEYYARFWENRWRGNVDYSIFPQASQFMRSYGSLNEVARVRRARSGALFWGAMGIGLGLGSGAGWLLLGWRRWREGAGDFAWLEIPAYLPVVTTAVLAMLALREGAESAVDYRPIITLDPLTHWKLLIVPALVLGVPVVPLAARFWLAPTPSGAGWVSPAWIFHHGRRAACAVGGAMMLTVGLLPVVETAFGYPGMIEWAIRGLSDFHVVQAGLQTVAGLGLAAFILGGRPNVLHWPEGDAAPRAPLAARPAPGEGWFRRLAEHDGFVVSGYIIAGVAGILVLAGLFPGMIPADVDALRPLLSPSAEFPMGTDVVGRNIWRLMVEGSRVYLPLALLVTLLTLGLGYGAGRLAAWREGFRSPLRMTQGALCVLPGIWWTVAVVLLTGRGLVWMGLGCFLFSLTMTLGLFLARPAASSGAQVWSRPWVERVIYWAGIGLVTTAANFMLINHLGFLNVGTRYPGPEVGTTLRNMFDNLDLPWLVVSSPALLVLAVSVALFLPGRIILAQIAGRHRQTTAPDSAGAG